MKRTTKRILKGYAYAWITLGFFMRHPREPRPTVEEDELDRLLKGEKPELV